MRLFKYLIILFILYSSITQAQTWTQLFPTGNTPSRDIHTSIYDALNNRMTTFGGDYQNDVWVLSNANGLSGTPFWIQLTTKDSAPTARFGHTAIYDKNNNRMIIFGGYDGEVYNGEPLFLNDVWVLSNANGLGGTPSWTQLYPSPDPLYGFPTGRVSHTAIYDTTNNMMVIFGGDPYGMNDVWVLSNANGLDSTTSAWTQLFPTGSLPPGRAGHTAVYDDAHNQMTVFGGGDNNVWVLSNANGLDSTTSAWIELFPTGSVPTSRNGHTAVYDNSNNRMTIFGGENSDVEILLNDVWVLSNANGLGGTPSWTQLTMAGNIPTARVGHTAIYDSNNNRMTIYGGSPDFGDSSLSDVWVLDDANGLPSPNYSNIPSLKLFTNQTLNNAFNMEDYNSGGVADSYSIVSNFMELSSLSGSSVNQAGYSSATVGLNTYQGSNTLGSSTVSNKVKYSTYKIYELPQVGLSVGNSWDVKVGNYTYDSDGLAVPPSFGNPDAIIVGDTTSISATWLNNTVIRITSLQSFSGAVNVDIIASPNASSPFGSDIDKERIEVFTNLLQHGSFNSASDTSAWGLQLPPGRQNLATGTWLANQVDSAGDTATGVWQFTFADISSGIKATPFSANYLPVSQGKWYNTRMRICDASSTNSDEALLFSFSQRGGHDYTSDISGDVYANGIPTTWTWMEAPFYVHASTIGNTAFPQFQFKANGVGGVNSVYLDEIQIIQATPKILEGTRGNARYFLPGGLFTNAASTTKWGEQGYFNPYAAVEVTSPPVFTLTSDTAIGSALNANFTNASDGANQLGFVWTYGNMTGGITTPAVTVGREYGATMQINIVDGLTDVNGISIARINVYNVPTNGAHTPLEKIEASAEVGVLVSGTLATVGTAIDPYAQLQFGVRADSSGILDIANVDLISDTNDPNFGDATLFP